MGKLGWIIFSSVVVLLLGGLVVYSRVTNPGLDVSAVNENAILAASDQNGQIGDHVEGNADSDVILIEYLDFQCPSCAAAHPQLQQIMVEYGDRIALVSRNFPLTTIHPNARAAAAAAEAAGLQGKYDEMKNALFEAQSQWQALSGEERNDQFVFYAEGLGMNGEQFLSDLGSEAINAKISFDQALAKKVGASSTPSFFLNGEALDPAIASALVQGDTTGLTDLLNQKLTE